MNVFAYGTDGRTPQNFIPKKGRRGAMDRDRVDAYWEATLEALGDSGTKPPDRSWLKKLEQRLDDMGRQFDAKCSAHKDNLKSRYFKRVVAPGVPAQNQLGDAVRWLALLKVIVHHRTVRETTKPTGAAEECLRRYARYAADKGSKLSDLWGLLWITAKGRPGYFSAAAGVEFVVLLDWFNDLAVRRGRNLLTAQDIVNRPAVWGENPADTLQAFHDWLITDVWLARPAKRPAAAAPPNDQLETKAKQAAERLLASSVKQAPVVNVICGDARSLVEPFVDAVAAYIGTCDEKESEKNGEAQTSRKPDWALDTTIIRLAVGVGDEPMNEQDRRLLTTTDVLLAVAEAFGIPADARELRESDRVYRHVMAEVRRACSLRRTVIVLHVIESFEGRHAPLLDLMKGRGWGAFVRVLCQPHWQTAVQFWTEDGLQEIRGARLLVISDAPMATLRRWASAPIRLTDDTRVASDDKPAKPPSWMLLVESIQARPPKPPQEVARSVRDLVMLAFVACSPDGVSYGALMRGLRHWLDLAGRVYVSSSTELVESPDPEGVAIFDGVLSGDAIISVVDELLRGYEADIIRSVDEPLPWVIKERVRFEWQTRADVLDLAIDADVRVKDLWNAKIHFRSETKRRLFIRTVLSDAERTRPAGGWPFGVVLGDHLWRLVNFSIALESLRQATSQLRSLEARDAYKLEATRRLVQTIYHLRAVGDIDISGPEGAYAPYLSIPKAPAKRFRYTFLFLLRKCVDGDRAFRLARTHAASEIRVPLLALFLVDDVRSLECGRANDEKEFVAALEKGYERWQKKSKPTGQELLPHILVSLATSAIDGDDFAVARWALGKIQQGGQALQASDAALIWSGREIDERRVVDSWAGGYGAKYAKLQFDLLDKSGKGGEAEQECQRALSVLLANDDVSRQVTLAVDAYLPPSARGSGVSSITVLEKLLSEVITRQVDRQFSARRQMAISEMLFRKADVLASEADGHDRMKTPRETRLNGLLLAFGHFFLADRLRSAVAGKSGYGDAWSRLSAKGNRVYVRTCLAIARAFVELDDPLRDNEVASSAPQTKPDERRRLYEVAIEFMQHAAHRSDVFVRHLHSHRREVLHGLLLKSAEVRTWVTIAKRRPLPTDEQALPGLEAARRYLEDAETILHDMGVPNEPARRVWLERISLFIGSAKELHPQVASNAFAALVEAELATAARLMGGSDFWGPLIDRQRKRWKLTREKWRQAHVSQN